MNGSACDGTDVVERGICGADEIVRLLLAVYRISTFVSGGCVKEVRRWVSRGYKVEIPI